MDSSTLLDAADLAEKLKVKKPTVRFWCRTTDIPRLKLGRLVRFDYDEVLAWLRSRSEVA